jgi:sortase A
LIIPEIGLDTVVLQGWEDDVLRRGPGHAPTTAPPGVGNCVIAAHRNVYGSWFRRLDELLPDSVIQLKTPRATYTYRVALAYSITDTDTTVLQQPSGADDRPRLTLVTCTLPHSSTRLVTVAVRQDPNR